MIHQWLIAVGVVAGVWLLGWTILHLALEPLRRLLRRSKTHIDDLALRTVRKHLPIWFLALGVAVGVMWAPVGPVARLWTDRTVGAIVTLSVCWALASFFTGLIALRATPGQEVPPVNSLIQSLIRVVVMIVGLVLILGQLGVAIAPLLTALGVSSLAVALALQPTLTNLFAGLSMLLSNRIRVGDYVELESGQAGVVTDIGWRSTLLEELAGNTFVIPNSKFAEMVLKNYNLPVSENALSVEVRLAPSVDLEQAERVAREVAKDVQRTVSGAIHDFEPGVVYKGLGDTGVLLGIVLRVRDYRDRGAVTSELIKRLYRRYGELGVELSVAPRHVPAPAPAGAPPGAPSKPVGV
jgi:small-conductance mechanosensitive channel